MTYQQAVAIASAIEKFLSDMGCQAMPLEDYVRLGFKLAAGEEFVSYRSFDRFTELNINIDREPIAIVNVRAQRHEHLTSVLNQMIALALEQCVPAAA